MFRSVRFQTLSVLAVGILLGYLAASDRISPSPHARAAPGPQDRVRTPKSAELTADTETSSCSEGVNKGTLLAMTAPAAAGAVAKTQETGKKPNIVVIMGDDVGIWNIGAYHRGMMAGRTPNLDRLASQGLLFTDYYAEASCTAGRANFITGQLPIRTGLTTVGQAGSPVGLPAQAPTIATVAQGYGLRHGPVRQEPPG